MWKKCEKPDNKQTGFYTFWMQRKSTTSQSNVNKSQVKRWKATKDSNAQNHAQVGFASLFWFFRCERSEEVPLGCCGNDKKVERPIIKRITKNDKEQPQKIRK
jgi:hypothetical protein